MLKKLFIISIVMLFFLPNVLAIPFFDSSFTLRQEYNLTANYTITVTEFTNLTNYTAYLSFDTQTLISQGKLNSDCSDIRVVDAKTNQELNFEIEQGTCNSPLGTPLFIRFPVLNHDTTGVINNVMIYYNNSAATFKSAEFSQDAWDKRYDFVWHISNGSRINSVNGQILGSSHNLLNGTSNIPVGNMLNVTSSTDVPVSSFNNDDFTNHSVEVLYIKRRGDASTNEEFLLLGGAGSARQNGLGGKNLGAGTFEVKIYSTRSFNSIDTQLLGTSGENTLHYGHGAWFQNAIGANEAISRYIFDGTSTVEGSHSSRWDFSGDGNPISINDQTVFASGQGFRGEVTEVRVAKSFSMAHSQEYARMNTNIFLDQDNFWVAGSEESFVAPPEPPPITGQVAFETTGTSGILVRAGSIALTLVILLGLFLELVFRPLRSKLKGK